MKSLTQKSTILKFLVISMISTQISFAYANTKEDKPSFLTKIEKAKELLSQYPTGNKVLSDLNSIYQGGLIIIPASGTEYPKQFNFSAAVQVSEQSEELGINPQTGQYFLRIKPDSDITQMAHAIAHGVEHAKIHKQLDYFSAVNPSKISIVVTKTNAILNCLKRNGFQICEMGYRRSQILQTIAYSLLDEYRAFMVNQTLHQEGMPAQELLEKGTVAELFAQVYWPMYSGFRITTDNSKKIIQIMEQFATPMDMIIKHHPELNLERYDL